MLRTSCVVIGSLWLVGCGFKPSDIVDPPTITLKQALIEVADGLHETQKRTQNRQKFGLIVDEVTVQFNVSAKATSTGNLGITGSSIPAAGGVFGLKADSQLVNDGTRGNVVTIKLKHVDTADLSKGSRVHKSASNGDYIMYRRDHLTPQQWRELYKDAE